MDQKDIPLTTFECVAIIEGIGEQPPEREEVVAAFQRLIDTHIVWQLQGWYGRTASQLISSGICRPSIQ